jgi:hypothetical protein
MTRSARISILFAAAFVAVIFATELASRRNAASDHPSKASSVGEAKGQYIRVKRDKENDPISMETAIVRFEPKEGDPKSLSVDLISAVHVGEKSYYDALNKRFESYDVVLYELVAPEGTRVPKGGKTDGNALSSVQNGLKDLLELEYQLAGVDYTKKNLVHADMSPEDFAKSMEKKGESIWTILVQMAAAEQARQKTTKPKSNKGERYWSVVLRGLAEGLFPGVKVDPEETKLMMALMDRNRALKLKRVLADQFEDMESMMAVFNGPDGSTLITERNKAALKVLKREMESGHTKIAIFYGGGHMPDFEKRLVEEFNLKRTSDEWLEAWDLRDKE